MSQSVKPTGATHEVGIDQLFFSTTDGKGVIELSNEVFVELSRYQRNQLIGAPHNIIRHPDMPSGVFAIMWQRLEDGLPFAGYVENLAQDGSTYRVFALVTPLPDGGYLSVRQRPMLEEQSNQAWELYETLRAEESANFEAGANRREVARFGAEQLLQKLSSMGLKDFGAYQAAILPDEVAARLDQSAGIPQRPDGEGAWSRCLQATSQMHSTLNAWVADFEAVISLGEELFDAQRRLAATMGHVERTQALLKEASDDPAMLFFSFKLGVWVSMRRVLDRQSAGLAELLDQLLLESQNARFLAAASRMQTVVLAQYCAELVDGAETQDSQLAVETLISSVTAQTRQVLRAGAERQGLARQTMQKVRSIEQLLQSPMELLELALSDHALSHGGNDDLASQVRSILEQTKTCKSQLRRLGEVLEQAPELPEASLVSESLDQLGAAVRS